MLSYEIPLNLSLYLKSERDYVPWRAFLDCAKYLRGMLSTSNSYGTLQVSHPPPFPLVYEKNILWIIIAILLRTYTLQL